VDQVIKNNRTRVGSEDAPSGTHQLNKTNRTRLSLDVAPKIRERLASLEERTHAGSITEVIRRALSLYDVVVEHQEEGGKILFRHADGTEEFVRVL